MSADPVLSARGRHAHWVRFGDPAKAAEARQDLAAAMLERSILQALGVSALRPEQCNRLAMLLMAADIA